MLVLQLKATATSIARLVKLGLVVINRLGDICYYSPWLKMWTIYSIFHISAMPRSWKERQTDRGYVSTAKFFGIYHSIILLCQRQKGRAGVHWKPNSARRTLDGNNGWVMDDGRMGTRFFGVFCYRKSVTEYPTKAAGHLYHRLSLEATGDIGCRCVELSIDSTAGVNIETDAFTDALKDVPTSWLCSTNMIQECRASASSSNMFCANNGEPRQKMGLVLLDNHGSPAVPYWVM